jgi:hypothetical protein
MTTDTPRTDAFCEELPDTDFNHANWQQVVKIADFARELERELKRANDEIEFYEKIGKGKVDELRASKAEVERLKEQYESVAESVARISVIEDIKAVRERAKKAEAEVERLRSTMRSFIDFMDENLGTTADWPMEVIFDDEETCQRHCDHLNAMKRIVKPEGIN